MRRHLALAVVSAVALASLLTAACAAPEEGDSDESGSAVGTRNLTANDFGLQPKELVLTLDDGPGPRTAHAAWRECGAREACERARRAPPSEARYRVKNARWRKRKPSLGGVDREGVEPSCKEPRSTDARGCRCRFRSGGTGGGRPRSSPRNLAQEKEGSGSPEPSSRVPRSRREEEESPGP